MAINSKAKGNSYERKTANVLSARFEKHTGIAKAFKRNADSGSFMGGKNQHRMETHDLSKAEFGDIVSPDDFVFSVECKHYKAGPSFSMIIGEDCKMFDEWIKKGRQDAANSGRKLCVIMKFNNVQESVILDELFGDLKAIIYYKDCPIVRMTDFLKQEDRHFFIDKENIVS